MKFSNFLFPESRDPARRWPGDRRDAARGAADRRAGLRRDLAGRASFRRHLRLCRSGELRRRAGGGDAAGEDRLRGGADVAAPSDPHGGAAGADRPHQQGAADRRAGARHRLQHLRLPGLRPRPHRGAGALRGGRGDHVPGVARREVRAPRQVLGHQGADAAAAARSREPHPYCDPLRLERGRDAAHRATGPAVHDERAVERGDAPAHGPVPPHAARVGHGRCRGGAQRRAMLGVAQCVRRRDGCGGRTHRDPRLRGDARAPHGDAPARVSRSRACRSCRCPHRARCRQRGWWWSIR